MTSASGGDMTDSDTDNSQGDGKSLIARFYIDGAPDPAGRTLDEILSWDDEDLELCHDHIQWLFPLHEPSMFAMMHEVLTESDVELFSSSLAARTNMARTIARWRSFLGLGQPTDPHKWRDWAEDGDHNLLRITRSIRSIRLFGMEEEARALYEDVMQVSNERPGAISQHTLAYWHRAMQEPAMQPMRQNSGLVMPMAGIWRRFVDAMERMGAADMSDADRQEAEEKLLQELGVSSQR
eukprot:CAMPEP_0202920580 /NCGR_PEP_ID=MMETSP1392-20130828/76932_1 /ASSEMBLY_ACC=CAM_ASM_000868 /TAXON_ID=225041 /ORGANISM="Chlamydomonas chlamydogama, Strain SAG 11-48b" /LENGTH=237 /DNA_ID=CAMNT_0049614083 /DNA_START=201 /DNA_END=914 /DNA_ORIENTATION=-